MLHIAYQNQHKEPGILMGLRTVNDRIPCGERAFILASNQIALEHLELPVKVNNFVKKEDEHG